MSPIKVPQTTVLLSCHFTWSAFCNLHSFKLLSRIFDGQNVLRVPTVNDALTYKSFLKVV